MKFFRLFASLALTGCAVLLQAQNAQQTFGFTGEKEFNKHYYRLYTGQSDLESAQKIAVRDGGYLVSIDTAEENQFLNDWLGAYVGKFLIGASRDNQGKWLGADNKPLTFTNWSTTSDNTEAKTPAAAAIEFNQSGGRWETLVPGNKVAGFILEFNTLPKPPPKFVETFGFDEPLEGEEEELDLIEKNEPVLSELPNGGLSANLLFSKYVYAGGVFRDRYVDKEISVAGITRVADIREITEKDRLWAKYKGKYFMRLLGDNIICFLNTKPLFEGDSTRVIVKVEGKITKGPQFQQVILEDARFLNYRRVQPQRRIPTGKPGEEMAQVGGLLTKFDSLLDKGSFELQTGKDGASISCTIDNDPDGYGIELYWLKRTSGIENLMVSVIGMKTIPEEADSPMINCRLGGWADPAAAKQGGGQRRGGQGGGQPPAQ